MQTMDSSHSEDSKQIQSIGRTFTSHGLKFYQVTWTDGETTYETEANTHIRRLLTSKPQRTKQIHKDPREIRSSTPQNSQKQTVTQDQKRRAKSKKESKKEHKLLKQQETSKEANKDWENDQFGHPKYDEVQRLGETLQTMENEYRFVEWKVRNNGVKPRGSWINVDQLRNLQGIPSDD